VAKWWMGGAAADTGPEPPVAGGRWPARMLRETQEERGGPAGRLPHRPAREMSPIDRFKIIQTKNSNDFKKK
jgi:hypothetical protein